jgi:hypothetical protein
MSDESTIIETELEHSRCNKETKQNCLFIVPNRGRRQRVLLGAMDVVNVNLWSHFVGSTPQVHDLSFMGKNGEAFFCRKAVRAVQSRRI